MHPLLFDGTEKPAYGLVRGSRGIVLLDGILLMEGICDQHGACSIQWPETLPTKIEPMHLAPWRKLPLESADPKILKGVYQQDKRSELAGLKRREDEVRKFGPNDYALEFGVTIAVARQRLPEWKRTQLHAVEERKAYLGSGFSLDGKTHVSTIDTFLSDNREPVQRYLWEIKVGAEEAMRVHQERQKIHLKLEAMNPKLRSSPQSTKTYLLINAIRYRADYPDQTLYLRSVTKVPHDSESLASVDFYTSGLGKPKSRGGKGRKGRRHHYYAVEDDRMLKRYEAACLRPGGMTMEAFAREHNMTKGDLERQLQRARGRRRRRLQK